MLRGKSAFRIGSTHGIGLEIAPVFWPGRVQYHAEQSGHHGGDRDNPHESGMTSLRFQAQKKPGELPGFFCGILHY